MTASAFTYQMYEAVPSAQLHIDTAASALQIKNLGPAVALVIDLQSSGGLVDGQTDDTTPNAVTTGWPLWPGETLRVPGGSALVNVMQTPDALRARLSVIRES